MQTPGENFLQSAKTLFAYYKSVGDKTIARLNDDQLHWRFNDESNSVALIIKHITGNSISRWTDFLTTDGEKKERNRDKEFEDEALSKESLIKIWDTGWQCLSDALEPLTDQHLLQIVTIRNEGHTVTEAINRQLAHLPYHIGQMVYIGKMLNGPDWDSLTIPKGKSNEFNAAALAGNRTDKK